MVLEKNAVPDTTPPTVDSSKFTAVDNYNGTQDQLSGAAGAIGEADATVRAYRWTDSNADNTVDAGELAAAITLGASEADGSVLSAQIGDLPPGSYKFVITATDSSNNESAKDAAHVITLTLVNGIQPTVTMYTYGFDGGGTGAHTKQLNAGSTAANIRFDFFPGETIVNGVMVLNFEGITVDTNDQYNAGSWNKYTSSQISNGGHTVTLTGVNRVSKQDIAFMLYNKVIPAPGTYYITCTIDADGPGNTRTESVEHKIAIISVAP
ncbi:hypothetical protein CF651_29775 [Paenibacillus rigui]|uniref:Uncharacterized protein n=1 Tax=Paenibacillus rigui TaxID=554312 RepID=A0A229UH76_9BACL|nr:hypothetical protein CF651_29775 [Paenibacillus rigui]